jgi:hypothetical protein
VTSERCEATLHERDGECSRQVAVEREPDTDVSTVENGSVLGVDPNVGGSSPSPARVRSLVTPTTSPTNATSTNGGEAVFNRQALARHTSLSKPWVTVHSVG